MKKKDFLKVFNGLRKVFIASENWCFVLIINLEILTEIKTVIYLILVLNFINYKNKKIYIQGGKGSRNQSSLKSSIIKNEETTKTVLQKILPVIYRD